MNPVKKSSFEEELVRKGKIIYTNVGDSMLPLIRQGRDILIIERPKDWEDLEKIKGFQTTKKLKRLDIPLYRRDNGAYVLHRVLKVRDSDYVICGDNRCHREYGICDRHVIGVLTGVIREGKILSMSDNKIRVFSHIWCDFFWVRVILLKSKTVYQYLTGRRKKIL